MASYDDWEYPHAYPHHSPAPPPPPPPPAHQSHWHGPPPRQYPYQMAEPPRQMVRYPMSQVSFATWQNPARSTQWRYYDPGVQHRALAGQSVEGRDYARYGRHNYDGYDGDGGDGDGGDGGDGGPDDDDDYGDDGYDGYDDDGPENDYFPDVSSSFRAALDAADSSFSAYTADEYPYHGDQGEQYDYDESQFEPLAPPAPIVNHPSEPLITPAPPPPPPPPPPPTVPSASADGTSFMAPPDPAPVALPTPAQAGGNASVTVVPTPPKLGAKSVRFSEGLQYPKSGGAAPARSNRRRRIPPPVQLRMLIPPPQKRLHEGPTRQERIEMARKKQEELTKKRKEKAEALTREKAKQKELADRKKERETEQKKKKAEAAAKKKEEERKRLVARVRTTAKKPKKSKKEDPTSTDPAPPATAASDGDAAVGEEAIHESPRDTVLTSTEPPLPNSDPSDHPIDPAPAAPTAPAAPDTPPVIIHEGEADHEVSVPLQACEQSTGPDQKADGGGGDGIESAAGADGGDSNEPPLEVPASPAQHPESALDPQPADPVQTDRDARLIENLEDPVPKESSPEPTPADMDVAPAPTADDAPLDESDQTSTKANNGDFDPVEPDQTEHGSKDLPISVERPEPPHSGGEEAKAANESGPSEEKQSDAPPITQPDLCHDAAFIPSELSSNTPIAQPNIDSTICDDENIPQIEPVAEVPPPASHPQETNSCEVSAVVSVSSTGSNDQPKICAPDGGSPNDTDEASAIAGNLQEEVSKETGGLAEAVCDNEPHNQAAENDDQPSQEQHVTPISMPQNDYSCPQLLPDEAQAEISAVDDTETESSETKLEKALIAEEAKSGGDEAPTQALQCLATDETSPEPLDMATSGPEDESRERMDSIEEVKCSSEHELSHEANPVQGEVEQAAAEQEESIDLKPEQISSHMDTPAENTAEDASPNDQDSKDPSASQTDSSPSGSSDMEQTPIDADGQQHIGENMAVSEAPISNEPEAVNDLLEEIYTDADHRVMEHVMREAREREESANVGEVAPPYEDASTTVASCVHPEQKIATEDQATVDTSDPGPETDDTASGKPCTAINGDNTGPQDETDTSSPSSDGDPSRAHDTPLDPATVVDVQSDKNDLEFGEDEKNTVHVNHSETIAESEAVATDTPSMAAVEGAGTTADDDFDPAPAVDETPAPWDAQQSLPIDQLLQPSETDSTQPVANADRSQDAGTSEADRSGEDIALTGNDRVNASDDRVPVAEQTALEPPAEPQADPNTPPPEVETQIQIPHDGNDIVREASTAMEAESSIHTEYQSAQEEETSSAESAAVIKWYSTMEAPGSIIESTAIQGKHLEETRPLPPRSRSTRVESDHSPPAGTGYRRHGSSSSSYGHARPRRGTDVDEDGRSIDRDTSGRSKEKRSARVYAEVREHKGSDHQLKRSSGTVSSHRDRRHEFSPVQRDSADESEERRERQRRERRRRAEEEAARRAEEERHLQRLEERRRRRREEREAERARLEEEEMERQEELADEARRQRRKERRHRAREQRSSVLMNDDLRISEDLPSPDTGFDGLRRDHRDLGGHVRYTSPDRRNRDAVHIHGRSTTTPHVPNDADRFTRPHGNGKERDRDRDSYHRSAHQRERSPGEEYGHWRREAERHPSHTSGYPWMNIPATARGRHDLPNQYEPHMPSFPVYGLPERQYENMVEYVRAEGSIDGRTDATIELCERPRQADPWQHAYSHHHHHRPEATGGWDRRTWRDEELLNSTPGSYDDLVSESRSGGVESDTSRRYDGRQPRSSRPHVKRYRYREWDDEEERRVDHGERRGERRRENDDQEPSRGDRHRQHGGGKRLAREQDRAKDDASKGGGSGLLGSLKKLVRN